MDDDQLKSNRLRRQITEAEFEQIRESLKGLEFGAVQITVQDGVIVQIDRTEKRRLRVASERRNRDAN